MNHGDDYYFLVRIFANGKIESHSSVSQISNEFFEDSGGKRVEC
jgi:hypothetical protein